MPMENKKMVNGKNGPEPTGDVSKADNDNDGDIAWKRQGSNQH